MEFVESMYAIKNTHNGRLLSGRISVEVVHNIPLSWHYNKRQAYHSIGNMLTETVIARLNIS